MGARGDRGEAWQTAAREVFVGLEAAQKKACPKSAFLGLCEAGLVSGIPRQDCGAGPENKEYAVQAVKLLAREPTLAKEGASSLWERVMDGRAKRPNSQMEVVLELWEAGLILSSP